jgi:hypothetical protein
MDNRIRYSAEAREWALRMAVEHERENEWAAILSIGERLGAPRRRCAGGCGRSGALGFGPFHTGGVRPPTEMNVSFELSGRPGTIHPTT